MAISASSTFDALGGEMVAVDGRAYDVRFDGRVVPVAPARRTPFAAVTYFDWGGEKKKGEKKNFPRP